MKRIAIISSSVRDGRISHRVAIFLKQYIEKCMQIEVELLDLKQYDFPLFNERLVFQQRPSKQLKDFTEKFTKAEGIIIVTPVYNGSFPASLKNIIDVYFKEWKHKPVTIVSSTIGRVPGVATIQALQAILLKIGAVVAPVLCTFTNTEAEFNEEGRPYNEEKAITTIEPMLTEFTWLADKIK